MNLDIIGAHGLRRGCKPPDQFLCTSSYVWMTTRCISFRMHPKNKSWRAIWNSLYLQKFTYITTTRPANEMWLNILALWCACLIATILANYLNAFSKLLASLCLWGLSLLWIWNINTSANIHTDMSICSRAVTKLSLYAYRLMTTTNDHVCHFRTLIVS